MKDKLNAVKTVLCAVFAAGCAVLGFFFWDASDRAGSLLEENDALREQLSVTQSDAKNAAAAASELQKQVDEMTAQIDELNSRLEQTSTNNARKQRTEPGKGSVLLFLFIFCGGADRCCRYSASGRNGAVCGGGHRQRQDP